jgi:hypothetical protein
MGHARERHIVGHGEVAHRRARMRLLHELEPDRHGHAAAGDLVADRRRVVAADPDRAQEVGGEAVEPDVAIVRRGAGLAGDRPAELGREPRGAALDDTLHHRLSDERDLLYFDAAASDD